MLKKKNVFILFVGICLCLIPFRYVLAVSAISSAPFPEQFNINSQGKNICFDGSTGELRNCTSNVPGLIGPHTIYKRTSDGRVAYCATQQLDINNGIKFTRVNKFTEKSRRALIIGQAMKIIEKKYGETDKAYLYITWLVNGIYADPQNSRIFTNGANKELKDILDEATSYYENTIKTGEHFPYVINDVSKSLHSVGNNTYVSDEIKISKLYGNYGGGDGTNNGDATYTITATAKNGYTASFCTDKAGTKNCTASKTLNKSTLGDNTIVSYYLKVVGNPGKDVVSVTVSGANASTYPSSALYEPSNPTYQLIVLGGQVTISRTKSLSKSFSVPNNNKHEIIATKLNTDGGELSGAEMILYRANKNDATNTRVGDILARNNDNDATIEYIEDIPSDNDTFFNYKYCLQETSAPNGYILNDAVVCYTPNGDRKTCLNSSSGDEESDLNYCDSPHYQCTAGDLNGTNCVTTSISSSALQRSCVSPAQLNGNNQCETEVGVPTVPDGGDTAVCPEGQLEHDDKCYSVTNPNLSCSTGDLVENECVITTQTAATCVVSNGTAVDGKYCTNSDDYVSIVQSGNNIYLSKVNEKTSVSISKKAATGDDEVPGAELKICATKPDNKGNCTIAVIDGEEVSWTSTTVPREWKGLETDKDYYLVEVTPPNGYIPVTITTQFKIESDGTVKTGTKTVTDNLLVIRNKLSKITISKDDIATSHELPGATLSICSSYVSNGKIQMHMTDWGDCSVVTLYDGSLATWVSTDKPHEVVGLSPGTYFLVEQTAPNGYSTAESIIFTLKADGTLVDKNGKSLKDNKLVMHDKKIVEVKTGMLGFYIVAAIVILGVVGGVLSYVLLKKNKAEAK